MTEVESFEACDRRLWPSMVRLAHLVSGSVAVGEEVAQDLTPETDAVWDVLRRLPELQRAAVVLRFYEDRPDDEIAELLGCRPATVRSLIHRALTRLQGVLQ